jgi:hypothetical protein
MAIGPNNGRCQPPTAAERIHDNTTERDRIGLLPISKFHVADIYFPGTSPQSGDYFHHGTVNSRLQEIRGGMPQARPISQNGGGTKGIGGNGSGLGETCGRG